MSTGQKMIITNITWERVYLTIDFNYDGDADTKFAITNKKRTKMFPIEVEKVGKNKYQAKINITNISERKLLPNDIWFFGLYDESILKQNQPKKKKNAKIDIEEVVEPEPIFKSLVDSSLAHHLEDLSRVYRYGQNNYAYIVTFTIQLVNEELVLLMRTSYMMRNKFPRRRRPLIETNTLKGLRKSLFMKVAKASVNSLYFVLSKITIKNGKNILFMSENRDFMSENLKAIDGRIKERELDKKFKIRYSIRNVLINKYGLIAWIKDIYKIAKSDYIFVDDYSPIFNFFQLSKKTKLIQVWHAGIGFKAVGYSRFGKPGSPYPLTSCHRRYDYALVGAEGLVDDYVEVFGIEREAILPLGLPRLDNYLDKKVIKEFKEQFYNEYPTFKNKKIILFAPTFRGTGQKSAYYHYDKIDFDQLYQLCGDEYVVLFKMHPFVREEVPIPEEYQDKFFDFYNYKNINELFYVTDILITDYSSNVYEYSLMKRPVIFYAYDKEVYEISRGVQRSLDDNAPGKVCLTFDELLKTIKNKDFEIEKMKAYAKKNFDKHDALASDMVIDKILLNK